MIAIYFGNLRSVTTAGGTVIKYIVDGKNRRVVKIVNVSYEGVVVKETINSAD